MNSKYSNGVRVERKAVDFLVGLGYIAARSAGSKGVFDVYAINSDSVRLIQCKSTEVALVLSRQQKVFTEIVRSYVQMYPQRIRDKLAKYVTFELWIHEKSKGFTYCLTVGDNRAKNIYPKGAIVLP